MYFNDMLKRRPEPGKPFRYLNDSSRSPSQLTRTQAGDLHDRSSHKKGAAMKRCPPLYLFAVLIAFIAVGAFAQYQTGNIYGKVQAKDGSVLPGVTVTLTGIGAPQTQYTDAQGNYRFLNLSPGAYTIKAELAGYGTATRSGVGVRLGANSDVT